MRLVWPIPAKHNYTRLGFWIRARPWFLGFRWGWATDMKIGLTWAGLVPDMACTSCKHTLNEIVQWRI